MITGSGAFDTSEIAYAVDRSGQIVAWNQAAEQTFGHKESEALGRQCWELLSGRDMFGNESCCNGCPVRAAAFKRKPVNQFQINFKTAAQERKRFAVRTVVLFNHPDPDVFLHLCQLESDVHQDTINRNTTRNHAAKCLCDTLTPRETEVLGLLHKGVTINEIATELGISPHTVRSHTQHILSKLHAHSRFEAVAIGRENGLI